MINNTIGKENIITIIGILRLRNNVINPNLFKSFLETGSVCNHLKAVPDIKLLVVKSPKRNTYKITIIRFIQRKKPMI